MPAVPLALAEIEERLEEIRYLLNRRSLTAVIAPVIGALLGLAALVVWSTSYATAQTFGVGLYAAVGAAVLLFAWSGLVLRQRWINLEEAARIADDRANMRQRLQTSLWLARSGQQPSFTPVLVADTLGRRDSWKAAIPRSTSGSAAPARRRTPAMPCSRPLAFWDGARSCRRVGSTCR